MGSSANNSFAQKRTYDNSMDGIVPQDDYIFDEMNYPTPYTSG